MDGGSWHCTGDRDQDHPHGKTCKKEKWLSEEALQISVKGCESWTVKKAEHRRIDAFELSCWRRLLRVLWTARRSNQSTLRRPVLGVLWKDWCWGWNSNTLATSCEELTHWKRPWCWEGLGAGGEGDDRGWDGWMASPTRWTWVWVNSRSWWWTGKPGVLWFMGSQRVGHNWVTELNWTEDLVRSVNYCDFVSGFLLWIWKLPLWELQWLGRPCLRCYVQCFR